MFIHQNSTILSIKRYCCYSVLVCFIELCFFFNLLISQSFPVNPEGQTHSQPTPWFIHVPPFSQGTFMQGFKAERNERKPRLCHIWNVLRKYHVTRGSSYIVLLCRQVSKGNQRNCECKAREVKTKVLITTFYKNVLYLDRKYVLLTI